jgi:hypothetical protein
MGEDRKAIFGTAVAATKAGDNAAAVRVFVDGVNAQPERLSCFRWKHAQ